MSLRYFEWIRKETDLCKIYQEYIENKTWYKSFLSKRENKQASIDFLWRIYNSTDNKTIKEVALEVRTLKYSKSKLEELNNWFLHLGISKLNELIKFWRIGKEVLILYLLWDEVYYINFDYYLKHNFEIEKMVMRKENWSFKDEYIMKIPLRNLILIWNYNPESKEKNIL